MHKRAVRFLGASASSALCAAHLGSLVRRIQLHRVRHEQGGLAALGCAPRLISAGIWAHAARAATWVPSQVLH